MATAMTMSSHVRRWGGALSGALRARLALMRKAGTFAAIGVVNTAVDFGVFMAASSVLGLELMAPASAERNVLLVVANVFAWMIAVSGSYVLNSFITFAAESGRKLTLRAFATFVASGVAGLVGNTATVALASQVVPLWLAKLFAIGVSFLINFSMSHFVVFRARGDGAEQTQPRRSV
jgi:putative flippase GtrA